MNRCSWCLGNSLYEAYHDTEWGKPVHDDRTLFEFLILEGAQAGLSWLTILKKREGYKKAFCNFDPVKVADFKESDIQKCMENKRIIRNRKKIQSAVKNAKVFLDIQKEWGSFDRYLWNFTENKVIKGNYKNESDVPTKSTLSEKISGDLKKRGMTFVGPVIIYSYLQAVGILNDHISTCDFR